MAAVNMTAGLKVVGDRASAVASFGGAMAGMSVDDNTHTFLNSDTATNTQGASPDFQGNALDSTPTGGSAATPYVVSHIMTVTTGQFNTFTVKRLGLHNSASPTDSTATLMFGVDGFSIVKQSSFKLVNTFKLSYS